MKTLANDLDRSALLDRLRQVNPASQRLWGKMTPHQMKEAPKRRDAGEPMGDIARSYNVSHGTISRLAP